MYSKVVDDMLLFKELINESSLSNEIKRYIRKADKKEHPKQKLLDIPNNVIEGKLPEKNTPIKDLLKKMKEFEWILMATGDKYRSNSIHQIRVFLLGYLLLYKCNLKKLIKPNNNVTSNFI